MQRAVGQAWLEPGLELRLGSGFGSARLHQILALRVGSHGREGKGKGLTGSSPPEVEDSRWPAAGSPGDGAIGEGRARVAKRGGGRRGRVLKSADVEGAGPGGGISGGGSDVELLTQRVRHAGPTRQRGGERDRLGGGLGCGLFLLLLGSAHWPFLFSFFVVVLILFFSVLFSLIHNSCFRNPNDFKPI